ncbi:protein NUCLEAR FUSION DEFECTIVE 6, mitochondrial isoform X4 [Rhodamnia argentea]|uniref:Protein NUCLEAR FUSION DEFECTIVE 6, mitochondrial isoform X4 n=1 Tax=Rhodamnia argentea TaxID=178133 RepID=A0ABM3HXI7_9MYRT|nr:protein NUCLEAR FUSION DEFECTIVE 6, mitochondrial isoform X4 [Rhodamnia argentea]XP_048141306.1 protein NUCLEAR FUSION DEFECTIVE 6, mitochondrial isoform X4 [Rhodamnia argentea]XP_048141307.1 protein NUCLEAR FUSION DEFECTIVE 6, mitochondrial isoform X4 [Rhodamnia argentea]
MSAAAAARSLLRSPCLRNSASAAKSAASGLKPRPARSPFRMPAQKPMSHRIFRSPMEMSSCLESMLPYHTATASALLTSMLSVSQSASGWTPEGQEKTR